MDVDVGSIIAGKYELERLIGQGGMGDVWRARHVQLGERVVVKLMRMSDDEDSAAARGRFDLEAKIAARLSRRSRHVVSVIDQGEQEGVPFLVMELLEGESLEDVLGRTGVVPLPLVATVVTHVARALLCAHAEGVIHRDLKPPNVFLTKDEDGNVLAKVVDFGIARVLAPRAASVDIRAARYTQRGMVIGTPAYMSPEQAKGARNVGPECDVWALAVSAYECLTRQPPFTGEFDEAIERMCRGEAPPVTSLRADAPAALDAVFVRAFAPDKSARFPSAQAFAEAFARAIGELPAPAPRHESPAPVVATAMGVPPPRRWVGPIAVVASVLALGVGAMVWRSRAAPAAAAAAEPATTTVPAPVATTGTAATPVLPSQAPLVDVSALPRQAPLTKVRASTAPTSAPSATPSPTPAPSPSSTAPVPSATATPKPAASHDKTDKSEIF